MGLTIHWTLQARGKRKRILGLLEAARELCSMLEFEHIKLEVSDVMEYDWEAFDKKEFDDGWRWSHIQGTDSVSVDPETKKELSKRQVDRRHKRQDEWLKEHGRWYAGCTPGVAYTTRRPREGYFFRVCIDEGCEPCNIALALFGDRTMLWENTAFCKTQYASHFLESHLAAVAVMDICKAVGMKVEVSDEGEYWETRSLKTLAAGINESTRGLEGLVDMLTKIVEGSGGSLSDLHCGLSGRRNRIDPDEIDE